MYVIIDRFNVYEYFLESVRFIFRTPKIYDMMQKLLKYSVKWSSRYYYHCLSLNKSIFNVQQHHSIIIFYSGKLVNKT